MSWILVVVMIMLQVFGTLLVIGDITLLRRRKKLGSSVLEDEVRPALRWVGIAMMVLGGAVAGWVLRAAGVGE